nr:hypothetical protein CFP56_09191 [Quercus suber]
MNTPPGHQGRDIRTSDDMQVSAPSGLFRPVGRAGLQPGAPRCDVRGRARSEGTIGGEGPKRSPRLP